MSTSVVSLYSQRGNRVDSGRTPSRCPQTKPKPSFVIHNCSEGRACRIGFLRFLVRYEIQTVRYINVISINSLQYDAFPFLFWQILSPSSSLSSSSAGTWSGSNSLLFLLVLWLFDFVFKYVGSLASFAEIWKTLLLIIQFQLRVSPPLLQNFKHRRNLWTIKVFWQSLKQTCYAHCLQPEFLLCSESTSSQLIHKI